MSIFRDLEKRIDQQLKKLFSAENASAEGKELIEIQRAILDEIEDRSQMLPRAKRKFPYNDLLVRIPAVDPDRRAAIELVFTEGNALQTEIEHHLQREGIEYAADLCVKVEGLEQPPAEIAARGYHIVYGNRQAEKVEAPVRKTVRLTILHGAAEQSSYEVTKGRVHIGRLAEVLDERRRPVRRNDVAFTESSDKPNSTISRAHAHLEFDAATGDFRLFDDGSSYGTSVMQDGRLIHVPPAGGRGLRLQSGDEIYIGQARMLFETI